MTIQSIVDGLGTALDTIDGLRVTNYVPDSANVPAAWVVPPEFSPHRAMSGGLTELDVQVVVFVSAATGPRVRAEKLYGYQELSGAGSVFAALYADKTLGGACSDLICDRISPLGIEEVAAYQLYGGVWDLRVITEGLFT